MSGAGVARFVSLLGGMTDHRVRFICTLGAFACVASVGIFARAMGDTLFLGSYPPAALSVMYVVTAATLALLAFRWPYLSARFPVERLLPAVVIGCVVIGIALRAALLLPWPEVRAIAYVYCDLMCRIPMLLFWGFAMMVFDHRDSKRLLGFIGAAGTAACIAAGAAVRPLTMRFGTEELIWPIVLLLLGFGALVRTLARREPELGRMTGEPIHASTGGVSYYLSLIRTRQLGDLAALVAVGSFTLMLNDFAFKTTARAHFEGAALAGFFGSFYSLTSIASLVVQLLLVRLILQRAGVSVALLLLPLALLTTSLGVLTAGTFEWIVAAKFVEPVLEFTINVAAIQMLYLAVRKQKRSQARSLADGIARPVAIALAGLATAALAQSGAVPLRVLGGAIAASSLLWLWLARRNYRNYFEGLMQSIGVHRLDLSSERVPVQDMALEGTVREALRASHDDDVPYLLGLLPAFEEADWSDEYRALLDRDRPELKVASLDWLRASGSEGDLEKIRPLLAHPAPEVRLAAVRATAALTRGEVADALVPLLSDEDSSVRAATAAELMNSGDLEGLLTASVAFREMLASTDVQIRAAAAGALGFIRHDGLNRPLSELLRDDDSTVRTAAAFSASQRRRGELTGAIVELLKDPDTAQAAGEALIRMGPAAVGPMRETIERTLGQWPLPDWLESVPPILAAIGPEAAPLLRTIAESDDVHLRSVAIRSLVDVLGQTPQRSALNDLRDIAVREATRASETRLARTAAAGLPGHELVCATLDDELATQCDAIFAVLRTLLPSVDVRWLRGSLNATGEARGAAIEVLDNALEGELKRAVLALFEPIAQKAISAPPDVLLPALLARRSSIWLTAGAAWAAGRCGATRCIESLRALLDHGAAEVREAAFDALTRLESDRGALLPIRERLSHDAYPGVRRLAATWFTETRRNETNAP